MVPKRLKDSESVVMMDLSRNLVLRLVDWTGWKKKMVLLTADVMVFPRAL